MACGRDSNSAWVVQMSVENILQHLDKVKRTGQGRWMACCPAHNDRSPSLSIRELDDGRALIHCFSGCDFLDVLGAVGLSVDVLYPETEIEYGKPERRPFPANDILRAILGESTIVYLCAKDVSNGQQLSPGDLDRLLVAVGRIQSAIDAGMLNHG